MHIFLTMTDDEIINNTIFIFIIVIILNSHIFSNMSCICDSVFHYLLSFYPLNSIFRIAVFYKS